MRGCLLVLALGGCSLIDGLRGDGDDGGAPQDSCADPDVEFNGCRIAACGGALTLNAAQADSMQLARVLGADDDVVASTVTGDALGLQLVHADGSVENAREISAAPNVQVAAYPNGVVAIVFEVSTDTLQAELSDGVTAGTAGTLGAHVFGNRLALLQDQGSTANRAAVVWADDQTMTLRHANVEFGVPSTFTNERLLAVLSSLPTPALFDLTAVMLTGTNTAVIAWVENAALFYLTYDITTGIVISQPTEATPGVVSPTFPRLVADRSATGTGALLTYIGSSNDLISRRISNAGTISPPTPVGIPQQFSEATLVQVGASFAWVARTSADTITEIAMNTEGIVLRGAEALPVVSGKTCGPIAVAPGRFGTSPSAHLSYANCNTGTGEVDRVYCPGG